MAVDDIIAKYHGQWVLLNVTASDHGWETRGVVLAHAATRDPLDQKLTEMLRQQRRTSKRPGANETYTIFEAYPRIRTGAELRAALEEAWRTWPDEAFEQRVLSLGARPPRTSP